MWLLDRFSNPLWRRISRLDKARRRTVATMLCGYDFLRRQVEKKLVGPVETYLAASSKALAAAGGLTSALRSELVDEALLALLRSCTCPAYDPGLKVPRAIVVRLPEIWSGLVLANVNSRRDRAAPATLDKTGYSEDPSETHRQVLARWKEILGISELGFEERVNAEGFGEAWDWLTRVFIADTLDGMADVPDRMLFSQARRVAAAVPPHCVGLIEKFIEQVAALPAAA